MLVLGPLTAANGDAQRIPERSEIDKDYLWATETIFPNDAAWEAAFKAVEADIAKLAAYQGKLDDQKKLLEFLQLRDDIEPRFGKIYVYASLLSDQDTRVGKYQGYEDRLRGLGVQYGQATAWVEPELTAIPHEKIKGWMLQDADLALYEQYFDDLFRQQAHILSPELERLMALSGQVRSVPYNAYNLLSNADLQFPKIKDADGDEVELSDSAFYIFMRNPDRSVRKAAYEGIVGTYKNFRNTAAALLNGAVQNHILSVRAREYDSCLQAALHGSNIPVDVYQNLVDTVNDNLHRLHRYQSIRKRTLKLHDGVHAYDLFAPLTGEAKLSYEYHEAVDLMKRALEPLGPEYARIMAKGVDSRWIDVYPTKGKRSGAYSSGTYLTQPYILLNFHGGYEDVSTLAHEMGHSMHSFFSRSSQPYVYSDYDIFCAEVASVTNEILLQNYVLERIEDPETKLYLLTELLEGFRGTVFRQTMFSEFEQRIHEMAEAGQPLTADSMSAAYGEIMKKYYGPDYTHDELVDNYWIRIPHFYYNFYVYKYATSYCAASNIANRILAGEPGAVDAYLAFLKSGSSKYPIDLLKLARVDMTTREPVEDAMKYFGRLLDETERLLRQTAD
jgi:oligoendopeptidase F